MVTLNPKLNYRFYTSRENFGGNYCGHNPKNPKLKIANPVQSNIPLVLRRLNERIITYYSRPMQIPSLNFSNDSNRQQRSERREACVLVLLGLIKFTDLASLRVGIPTSEGFFSLPVNLLAKHVGLPLLRTSRALSSLVQAGLLTSTSRRKLNHANEYRSLASVRCINKELFGIFGLLQMLRYERDKAIKRLKEKEIKVNQKEETTFNYAGLSRYRVLLKSLQYRSKCNFLTHDSIKLQNDQKSYHSQDSYYYILDKILGKVTSSQGNLTDEQHEKEHEMKKKLMIFALKFREKQHNLNETCWSREKCYENAANILEKARLRGVILSQ